MSAPAWMRFFPGDYLKDTMHLTTLEHGAYLLLLLHAWENGGRLPADEGQLAKIARLPRGQWRAVSLNLLPLFQVDGSGLIQKRVEREYDYARLSAVKRTCKASKAAKSRWNGHARSNA